MCGIFALHGVHNPASFRSRCIALSKRQRHRGPDWSGCYVGKRSVLVHERLAIVGVGQSHAICHICCFIQPLTDTGAQPLYSEDGKQILAVNGEIYNHIKLRSIVGPDAKFKTHSDCEVILHLVCKSKSYFYSF